MLSCAIRSGSARSGVAMSAGLTAIRCSLVHPFFSSAAVGTHARQHGLTVSMDARSRLMCHLTSATSFISFAFILRAPKARFASILAI